MTSTATHTDRRPSPGSRPLATDLRRAHPHRALGANEAFAITVVESSPDCIKVLDLEGNLQFMNGPGRCAMEIDDFGPFCGLAWAGLWPAEARAEVEAALEVARRGGTGRFTAFCPTAKGTPKWWDVVVIPIPDGVGRPDRLLSTSRDITAAKRAEEDLRRAKEEAERANLAKSKFLAAASHDLRQPIQGAMLLAAALERHLAPGGPGRGLLGQIELSLGALKGLLDALLDVSKLDSGAVTPEPRDFPLSGLLDELAATHGPAAEAKGLAWSVSAPGDAVVRSDPTLLGRVVRNLVENAIRYTPEGGRVEVSCEVEGAVARIEVRDTGVGIPADRQAEVFEEFVQIGNEGRDRERGLGLGLAIVRRLSALLGHAVRVSSAPGQGSVFAVEVPLGAEPAPARARQAEVRCGTSGRGARVLLVEDDALVALGLSALLEDWGYAVEVAASAAEALALVDGMPAPPDIVLSDYRLDGEVGTDVVRALRARLDPGLPGVLLTGETAAAVMGEAAAMGLAVVHKPVGARALCAVLEASLKAA